MSVVGAGAGSPQRYFCVAARPLPIAIEAGVPAGVAYTAYVEEAGDEGLGRGSRWFIVGAVIVHESNDLAVSRCIDDIKDRLGLEASAPVHWRNMKHPSMRRFMIDRVKKEDLVISYVVCDTYDRIKTSSLKGNGRLYAYAVRFLVERLSWFGWDRKQAVDLVFANRSNVSYDELKGYLERIQKDPSCRVKRGVIDLSRVRCQAARQVKLLQVADICNGACFNALEYDRFGYYDERYLLGLWSKIYRRKDNLFSYGLKFLPSGLHDEEWVRKSYPWLGCKE